MISVRVSETLRFYIVGIEKRNDSRSMFYYRSLGKHIVQIVISACRQLIHVRGVVRTFALMRLPDRIKNNISWR